MSPSPEIQQSLNLLLPAYSRKVPAKLFRLCESLVAQSRQRASHLKPDEEIARTFACCEIACKRLRAHCRLPAVRSHTAPCKPSVYKKLVAFLEQVLDGDANAEGKDTHQPGSASRGLKRNADGKIKVSQQIAIDEPTTPSKSTGKHTFQGKVGGRTALSTHDGAGEAPEFVMPSIRKLCKAFTTPQLAPHVYTGTCVVLRLADLWPRPGPEDDDPDVHAETSEQFQEKATGLLIALYLMTLTRMQTGKMTTSVYKSLCQRCVEELQYEPRAEGVEAWIRRINREGLCRGQDWWNSVPESTFDCGPDWDQTEQDQDEDEKHPSRQSIFLPRGAAHEHDPDGILLPGLATMMQPSVDYLDEERTQDFLLWKKRFLRKLDRLDQSASV